MKNTFLYILIFSILINIFQYVNSNKILDAKEKELKLVRTKNKANDSLLNLEKEFDLKNNEYAQEYFYNKGLDHNQIITKVTEDINELNTVKEGNPLVPYDKIDGKPFLINRVKFVNHRWVIGEFSNGKIWGEVVLKYFIVDDKPTEFELMDTVLFEATL
ncbi:hydrolase [Flavobacterium sp.]|uniref:hydrolase n=1 Tax=Flavobacterium sp. TaxID=239 RepID=UPI003F69FDC2